MSNESESAAAASSSESAPVSASVAAIQIQQIQLEANLNHGETGEPNEENPGNEGNQNEISEPLIKPQISAAAAQSSSSSASPSPTSAASTATLVASNSPVPSASSLEWFVIWPGSIRVRSGPSLDSPAVTGALLHQGDSVVELDRLEVKTHSESGGEDKVQLWIRHSDGFTVTSLAAGQFLANRSSLSRDYIDRLNDLRVNRIRTQSRKSINDSQALQLQQQAQQPQQLGQNSPPVVSVIPVFLYSTGEIVSFPPHLASELLKSGQGEYCVFNNRGELVRSGPTPNQLNEQNEQSSNNCCIIACCAASCAACCALLGS